MTSPASPPPITAEMARKLPKASLISVRLLSNKPAFWFLKNRLANAYRIQVSRVVIVVRAPWLERSARALYPHLFSPILDIVLAPSPAAPDVRAEVIAIIRDWELKSITNGAPDLADAILAKFPNMGKS